jgi:hypothetical protein
MTGTTSGTAVDQAMSRRRPTTRPGPTAVRDLAEPARSPHRTFETHPQSWCNGRRGAIPHDFDKLRAGRHDRVEQIPLPG